MKYDVIIIGAGAAGLMCAIIAAKRGRRVLLIDHAKTIGEKIRISGGGRCNFTNIYASPKNYISKNPHFCVSALKRYTQFDFIELVKKYNIAYHEKTLGQLFCDNSAKQIIDMLIAECKLYNVEFKLETAIAKIDKVGDCFTIVTNADEEIQSESLVIATGGLSIPKMGATGFGYDIAKQFGLNIIAPYPGLVPFTINNDLLKPSDLAGVSTEVIASCNKNSFKEALLFTHKGLSGPAILQISSYWNCGEEIEINFTPDFNLESYLQTMRKEKPNQELTTILAQILPKRLASYLSKIIGYEGKIADLSNKLIKNIADLIAKYKIIPDGTEGYRTAEVTIGGVDTDELSSQTLMAKKVPGLFFIGEVVDVTGHLGGFNFQWAWSSGAAAGGYV